ncbi:MAG: ester cyclase [Candidatus Omnitrophica bacterium]|nr:ester cyclase [Candidatus Omnitrophota bacterium]
MEKLKVNLEALKQEHWSDKELENAKLVTDFVQHIMNDHDFDYVLKEYGQSNYTQHNRNIPDGIKGLVGFLQKFVKNFPEYTYDVKRILADGDYIMFHSHATLKKEHRGNDKRGWNIIDTWKIKDGEIVEHWDSIQSLDWFMRFYAFMSGGHIRNTNGVF